MSAPDAQGMRLARMLGVCATLQAAGGLWLAVTKNTPIGTALFLLTPLSDPVAGALDAALAGGALALAVTLAWRPTLRAALALSLWMGAMAAVFAAMHKSYYAWIGPFAWAARACAPVCLAMLLHGMEVGGAWRARSVTLARVAVASTFAAHGLEALWLHPKFIDLVIASGHNLIGHWFSQSRVEVGLMVIGALDWVVALCALAGVRSRHLWRWAAFWGGLTAFSRVTQHGLLAGAPYALFRAPHLFLPLFVLLHVTRPRESLSDRLDEGNPEEEE